jgi:competence protein ComEC
LISLMSLALVAGFLLLATAWCPPLAMVFAGATRLLLAASEELVDLCDGIPGNHWYVGDVPEWWLWGFYITLFSLLLLEPLRCHWRWTVPAGAAWLCLGLLAGTGRLAGDELRCTFLAVGHGGCTVLETPDGRVLLYDTGAINGPEVTRLLIAPFLWQRGIRRIDEVILSHADLDHFNGLPDLLKRFAVGQVTCTPTFADKNSPGVRYTLEALARQQTPIHIVSAGDRLLADAVDFEVLHPPPIGPDGNENARSLVLLVRHQGHTLLLTGDLEGPGLQRVLTLPAPATDILMAPHHGSRAANTPELAQWARPLVVIACQGPPRGTARTAEPYTGSGAAFLGTWSHGAITVRSHSTGLVVETFVTGKKFILSMKKIGPESSAEEP